MSSFPFPYDLYHLWASARVARLGGNPYAPGQIAPVMVESGWPPSEGVSGFMHPFWSLTVLTPLSYLPFPVATLVWEASILVLLVISFRLILSGLTQESSGRLTPVAPLLLATVLFPPSISTFVFGQTNAILLLGCAGWFASFRGGRFLISGLLLSLTTLKPHLFLPLYVWIFINQSRKREWMCLTGFIAGVLTQCGIALAFAPDSAAQWLEAMRSARDVTQSLNTPTLSRIIGSTFNISHAISIATVAGGLVATMWALLRPGRTAELATLVFIPLGLLTSQYVWSHSFLVLLLPYLVHIRRLARLGDKPVIVVSIVLATWGILEICFVHTLGPYAVILPLFLLSLGIRQARQSA